MKDEDFDIENEQKQLVLQRLKTLNPNSKIMLGREREITVKELIEHVEQGDPFGKNIVKVQIRMLQHLTKGD